MTGGLPIPKLVRELLTWAATIPLSLLVMALIAGTVSQWWWCTVPPLAVANVALVHRLLN